MLVKANNNELHEMAYFVICDIISWNNDIFTQFIQYY